jgi:hypothetical protein
MIRVTTYAALSLLVIGCTSGFSNREGLELLSPTEVQLPYEGKFDKNCFCVYLNAIPNEPNAVKVLAEYDHCPGDESKEWTQHGEGMGEVVFKWKSGGAAKYYLSFGKPASTRNTVSKLTFSVRVKYEFAR